MVDRLDDMRRWTLHIARSGGIGKGVVVGAKEGVHPSSFEGVEAVVVMPEEQLAGAVSRNELERWLNANMPDPSLGAATDEDFAVQDFIAKLRSFLDGGQ